MEVAVAKVGCGGYRNYGWRGKMKGKALKIGFVVLLIFTISFIGLSYASQVWYGDMRDDYPYGLWIKAVQETEPTSYVTLSADKYISEAIENGSYIWVQQDDETSAFVNSDFPSHILWLPDRNYYLIIETFDDGIPESWNLLPPPATAAYLSAIPWAIFLVGFAVSKRRQKAH